MHKWEFQQFCMQKEFTLDTSWRRESEMMSKLTIIITQKSICVPWAVIYEDNIYRHSTSSHLHLGGRFGNAFIWKRFNWIIRQKLFIIGIKVRGMTDNGMIFKYLLKHKDECLISKALVHHLFIHFHKHSRLIW